MSDIVTNLPKKKQETTLNMLFKFFFNYLVLTSCTPLNCVMTALSNYSFIVNTTNKLSQ